MNDVCLVCGFLASRGYKISAILDSYEIVVGVMYCQIVSDDYRYDKRNKKISAISDSYAAG